MYHKATLRVIRLTVIFKVHGARCLRDPSNILGGRCSLHPAHPGWLRPPDALHLGGAALPNPLALRPQTPKLGSCVPKPLQCLRSLITCLHSVISDEF